MAEGSPISGKGDANPLKSIPENFPGVGGSQAPSGQSFSSAMDTDGTQVNRPDQITPMKMAENSQAGMQSGKVSPSEFISNLNNAIAQMNSLQSTLNNPGLKLNQRTRKLLKAKLSRTQENIDYISTHLDTDPDREGSRKRATVPDVDSKDDHKDVVKKFVGYLADGQDQLQGAMEDAKNIYSKDPGIMMTKIFAMQVKLYRAQVEIEFSTAVVQKSIDDIKTLMSVQL